MLLHHACLFHRILCYLSVFSRRIAYTHNSCQTQTLRDSRKVLSKKGLQPHLPFSCHSLPADTTTSIYRYLFTQKPPQGTLISPVCTGEYPTESSSLHPCLSKTAPSRLKPAQRYEPKKRHVTQKCAREPAVICNAEETQQQIVPPICPPVLIRNHPSSSPSHRRRGRRGTVPTLPPIFQDSTNPIANHQSPTKPEPQDRHVAYP